MIQADRPAGEGVCTTCAHPRYYHHGLGLKVEGDESPRVHVCLPITREVCECREFKGDR